MSVREQSHAARRGRAAIAVLFASCCAAFALSTWAVVRMRSNLAPHAPPEVTDPDQPIDAFVARAQRPDGTLIARLAPMHADAQRQSFEARALAQRLHLDAGEPWRLSASWDAAADAASLALGAVTVEDTEGVALRSLSVAADAADPVLTLLAAPTGELAPGESSQWVLWGRAPAAYARVVGLGDGALAIEKQPLRRSQLSLPLARADRVPAPGTATGKNRASRASEDGHGESDAGER